MGRSRALGLVVVSVGVAGVATVAAMVLHGRRVPTGIPTAGGILMGDVAGYDRMSRLLFGSLFHGVADDVAAIAPARARVLEVGCGPGQLAIELARGHGFEVTGIDLDPAMIERARANAVRAAGIDPGGPTFQVGDVAALPFESAEFDLVVSTFSMHHWSDRDAGLREIARVLRPGGRALVWDLAPGRVPFHGDRHGHAEQPVPSPLQVVGVTPWRWPWRLTLAQRFELARDERPGSAEPAVAVGA